MKSISSNQISGVAIIVGRNKSKIKNSFHVQLFVHFVLVTIRDGEHYSFDTI